MKQLPLSALRGLLAVTVLITSTLLVFIPFFIFCVLKIYPQRRWQLFCTNILHLITSFWVAFNSLYIACVNPTRITITGINTIKITDWYLVVANHQSWLDIVMLQYVLNYKARLPVLSFFIKDQLKWVPILGFCWWAMGYPFMKRPSKAYLQKNPHKKGVDLKTTLKAIEQFKKLPASMVSFVEGTRFTHSKHKLQQPTFEHLLKPKAGGISFVIGAMQLEIDSLLDVTIVYPHKNPSLWNFLCHRVTQIDITIRRIPIPAEFRDSNLLNDEQLQEKFKRWLNNEWLEKDHLIRHIKTNAAPILPSQL